MSDQFDLAEREVLAENTAQSILKHLTRLNQKRSAVGARWIWELLQNARDASETGGVHISIHVDRDALAFAHTGKPFTHKELAHLIYHGTTKLETKGDVGHFGSGFISTHLLSTKVRITGSLTDGHRFDFWLDRSSADQYELARAMRNSMEVCKQSQTPNAAFDKESPTTFIYPLVEESARDLVSEALANLKSWGPLVMALTPEIEAIVVEDNCTQWAIERDRPTLVNQGISGVCVTIRDFDASVVQLILVSNSTASVQVAVPISNDNNALEIALDASWPRAFVNFPLAGSEVLAIPAIVQSHSFEPFEDRDGLPLSGDSVQAVSNRELLDSAVPTVLHLVDTLATKQCSNCHQLMHFDTSQVPSWIDAEWHRQLLLGILKGAQDAPLVPTVSGPFATISNTWIPVANTHQVFDALWALVSQWGEAAHRLPTRLTAYHWSQNLATWAQLIDQAVAEQPQAITISRLAEMVSSRESTTALALALTNPDAAIEWHSQFLRLVHESGQTALHDEMPLLPDQNGQLKMRRELSVDSNIPDDLKNIASSLDIDVRGTLLATDVVVPGLAELLPIKTEEMVVDELLVAIKRTCHDSTILAEQVRANATLFAWLVARQSYHDRITELPIATTEAHDGAFLTTYLPGTNDDASVVLSPISIWPEGAQEFAGLFPARRIMHSQYADLLPSDFDWNVLDQKLGLKTGPLIRALMPPSECLFASDYDDDKTHECAQRDWFSDIACLQDKDVGLIDTARKSRGRAQQLLRFIVEYVLQVDSDAFEEAHFACECGAAHAVYRAAWLAPLKTRKWIPRDSSGHVAEYISSASLAGLSVEGSTLAVMAESLAVRAFLRALSVSHAEYSLRVMAPDEDSRSNLIQSISDLSQAAGGIEAIEELAGHLKDDPNLLSSIRKSKVTRDRIRRNQRIGQLVENLLRAELSAYGLAVTRTGYGSDFEVESDFIDGNQEVMLELHTASGSTLIEVKSTRTTSVRMTPLQVGTACASQRPFALCVIPIFDEDVTGDHIQAVCRFVFSIGEVLQPAWTAFNRYSVARDAAAQEPGAISIEIEEGQTRFKIDADIWSIGLGLEDAVAHILQKQGT